MKTKIYLILILSVFVTSCSSLQQTAVNDDLYYSPTDDYVASTDVYSNPTFDKNDSKTTMSTFDKQIEDILADDSKEKIDTTIYENKESENVYDRLIVDDYGEAYDRRLEAKKSPYYGMVNYNIYFNDDYRYASLFWNDPFYNVVIVGDRIWVEPYYISSSFSYWGRPYYNSYWYYGSPWYSSWYYSRPYYSYYSPYYYSNPYYYSPYYYNPYYLYPYSSNYNDNYVSSANYSYRRRGLSTMSSSGVNTVNQRLARNPEIYMGRDIEPASTVKSGIDNNTTDGRAVRRSEATARRSATGSIDARETIRVVDNNNSRGNITNTNRQDPLKRNTSVSNTERTRTYTRSQERSTYNTNRRTTRYSRPESTSNTREVKRSTSGTSTYTPTRSTRSNSSGSSRSYTPRRSSGSSGSTSTRSSGSSVSRSSGSSSGSSSTRSSGSGRRR
ncbi:MAG TPA: hypothetical protein VK982_02150 [Bacteroidales bacterium]|nr:hypothetical protein [Bacteroidales bacterium]